MKPLTLMSPKSILVYRIRGKQSERLLSRLLNLSTLFKQTQSCNSPKKFVAHFFRELHGKQTDPWKTVSPIFAIIPYRRRIKSHRPYRQTSVAPAPPAPPRRTYRTQPWRHSWTFYKTSRRPVSVSVVFLSVECVAVAVWWFFKSALQLSFGIGFSGYHWWSTICVR